MPAPRHPPPRSGSIHHDRRRIHPHRQCRPPATLVINRHRRRLPDRGENPPTRAAPARSVQAPTLSGRPDDARHLAELPAQKCHQRLSHDEGNAEISIALAARPPPKVPRVLSLEAFQRRPQNPSPRQRWAGIGNPSQQPPSRHRRFCDGFRMPARRRAIHTHRGPAFESRRGTKSREVGHPSQQALWGFGGCCRCSGRQRHAPTPATFSRMRCRQRDLARSWRHWP